MSDAIERELARLRREFDTRFTRLPESVDADAEDVLAIRVGPKRYALSLRGAGPLVTTPPLTPLPSRQAALLGLGAVRGSIVAVYDLGRLLGLAARASAAPRLMLSCAPAGSVAVAFDHLDGYHRVSLPEGGPPDGAEGGTRTVRIGEGAVPLLAPSSLLRIIEDSGGRLRPGDEEP